MEKFQKNTRLGKTKKKLKSKLGVNEVRNINTHENGSYHYKKFGKRFYEKFPQKNYLAQVSPIMRRACCNIYWQ